MDIYIPNIKLPKDEPGAFQVIVMYVGADGKLRAECEGAHEVTAVPPHGRLGDLDALHNAIVANIIGSRCGEETSVEIAISEEIIDDLMIIDAQQTVIPASKEG